MSGGIRPGEPWVVYGHFWSSYRLPLKTLPDLGFLLPVDVFPGGSMATIDYRKALSGKSDLVVLVTGGRDQTSRSAGRALFEALDELDGYYGVSRVVHGGAKGADAAGGDWAYTRGVAVRVHKADWKTWGSRAGPMRNQEMLDENDVDIVVALPGGAGTIDMKTRAARKGLPVIGVEL